MKIVIEFYRDFIGTANEELINLEKQINALDIPDDYFEYDTLSNQQEILTFAYEYFMDSKRWAEFKNLETLKLYVEILQNNYKSICEYSKLVLPVDGGELIGITQKEWDEIETLRYQLRQKLSAWTLFTDFCEYGIIL